MIRKAMRLNPNYPAQYSSVLGQAYYYLGEHANAASILRDAIDKNFSLRTAHIMLTATLSKSGRHDDASWSAEQLQAISPRFVTSDIERIFPIKNEQEYLDVVEHLKNSGLG